MENRGVVVPRHSTFIRPFPTIRPLALPAEHGAWGLLLEPVVLGLLVAPSASGFLIALAVIAAFLGRQPLKLAGQDWLRRRRYPRTAVCELLAATNFIAASLAFAGAWKLGGWMPLLALIPAIPLVGFQFARDVRMRGRNVVAELCGAAAPAASAAAIAIAGGTSVETAGVLAALMIGRSIPSVLFVRNVFSREPRKAVSVTAHVLALILAIVIAPWTAALAMLLLLVRSLVPTEGLRARTIGFREVGFGIITVLLIAAGYRI